MHGRVGIRVEQICLPRRVDLHVFFISFRVAVAGRIIAVFTLTLFLFLLLLPSCQEEA